MATHPDPLPNPETLSSESLAGRKGYSEHFLGSTVPLPLPAGLGTESVVLPYTNFSVVFRPDRRLAAATAVTIDGANLIDAPRDDDWRFDPRLRPESEGHFCQPPICRQQHPNSDCSYFWHKMREGPGIASHAIPGPCT